ncbi:immunoglobulin kappa light chain-like [Anabas testudineus]|uniref:Ig-like domain-containing protein n=1 Tax=Anabas testudineus TaxID=64144 RepID=A0A7N6B666_ANATE|nr:immunoglobulin kappa light chain-like [Anabas testudineus]
MMASPIFTVCLTCLFMWKMAHMADVTSSSSFHQLTGFVSPNVGDNLTLSCFYEGDVAARLYWYKQTVGQKPRLISTFYKYNVNHTFLDEFSNNPRFMLDTKNGKNHLTITNLNLSDSATYYCLSIYTFKIEFLEVTTVSVKGSGLNIQPLVHQSASETIQPGDSVTLNCTVHTGSCDGEHSVYWFKDSGESHPGIIYTHGDRNDQCERKPDTQTYTCIYNLSLDNLNISHAATYYCAVASCGHLLFGNGTKLDFKGSENSHVLLYLLSGALTFTTVLVVVLTFLLYKINSCQPTELQARISTPSTANSEVKDYQGDNLHYAAFSASLPNRSRKQRNNTKNECVYSSVKQ